MAVTRRRERIFGKRLTAVTLHPLDLSQSAGCTNTTWEEDQSPAFVTATPIMDDEEVKEPQVP